MKNLWAEYMSEFSGEDIKPEILAEELGVAKFRFPDEHYQHAELVVQQLVSEIIPHIVKLDVEEIGIYLTQHKDKIFQIFDTFPEMYRMPLLTTKNNLTAHGLTSAPLMGTTIEEFYNAFLFCMHFYLYLKSIHNLSKLYRRYPQVQEITHLIHTLAKEDCENELMCAWWSRSQYFFQMLFPKDKGSAVVYSILGKTKPYIIPPNSRADFKKKKVDFWRQKWLSPERILINVWSLIEDRISWDVKEEFDELDADALNFFLCQNHIIGYEEIISKIFSHKNHFPAWGKWIHRHIHLIKNNDSQTNRVFRAIFGIKDTIFLPQWLITREAKRKLPQELCTAILEANELLRQRVKEEKMANAPKVVAKIPTPAPARTAMEALITRPLAPKKEEVLLPHSRAFFVRGEAKKQLASLNLSSCEFPVWTTMIFERQLPWEKTFHKLDVNKEGETIIPPVQGEKYRGHFTYRLTVTLPTTHIFQGWKSQMPFEDKFYAEAEWTEEEKIAHEEERERIEKARQQRPEEKKQWTEKVVEDTPKKVVTIIDPKIGSLVAAACILLEKCEQYSAIDTYEGGPIVVRISDEDLIAVLNNESNTLLDEHREWTIQEDDSISPDANGDVREQLLAIATAIRTKSREKIQKQQEQEQEEREQWEYGEAREEFAPLLDFIRRFKFEWREGDLEKQRASLREELKNYWWSIPGAFAGTKVIWRHITAKIHILYETKQCHSSQIVVESGGNLNVAEVRCYQEIAEAGAHIARFFNVETRERTKMIKRETALNKEIQTGAEGYDKLLEKGQARLVLFWPYQQSHGLWSSKFPSEATPYMLNERASYSTIEWLLEQYPGAELCYRRDQFCINGEVGEEAGDESHENASQNINDLRNSPRARYILRKRILITLDLEKYTGDTYRAPIKHEKNKREGSTSALDILLSLKNEKNIQSVADIDEAFVDEYINLLDTHKIRVHYVWPISVGLDEHKRLIVKAKKTATTAG